MTIAYFLLNGSKWTMADMRAWKFMFLLFLPILLYSVNFVCGESTSYVSFKPGTSSINDEKPFRMNKLNLMWDKAKKSLEERQLPALYAEFVVQDRLEAEWKIHKAEGLDKDGQQEAAIHRKFLDILDQFKLRSSYPSGSSQIKLSGNSKFGSDKAVFQESIKTDKKLASLWLKAERAGFSEDELITLREEFRHHKDKLDEYDILRAEVDRLEGLSHNSIERFTSGNEFEGKDPDSFVKSKHSQLKSVYHDIKRSYDNLERLTEQVAAISSSEKQEFTDTRVRQLWSMALKANLSEGELSSFKTELGHFERRINKYNHFDKEMHMSLANLNMNGKYVDAENVPESHLKLSQKVQEYATKVKKWHSELKNRILKSSPHRSDEF